MSITPTQHPSGNMARHVQASPRAAPPAARTENSWSRHGGVQSARTGSDSMQLVMQTICGKDRKRGLYLWGPTAENYRKMHDALLECHIFVDKDDDIDKHPLLDFNTILFTEADIDEVVAWWAADTKSKIALTQEGRQKIWKNFVKFIHDWGLVAIKPADLKSKAGGPFCRGFIFRKEAWNSFGYRLAKGGRKGKVSRALKDKYHEITALSINKGKLYRLSCVSPNTRWGAAHPARSLPRARVLPRPAHAAVRP